MASIDLSRLIQEQIMRAGQPKEAPITENRDEKIANAQLVTEGDKTNSDPGIVGTGDKFARGGHGEEESPFANLKDKFPPSKFAEKVQSVKDAAHEIGEEIKKYPKAAAGAGIGAGALAAGAGLYKYLKAKKAAQAHK